jgi:PmbA protein
MAQINFLYTQAELHEIAATILAKAKAAGASAAQVELSESISTDLEVLNQEIDNFETSHENQLLLTVFKGQKKGNIGISAIKVDRLDEIIAQALSIATFTQEDAANGILLPEELVSTINHDLQLYNPITLSPDHLIRDTKQLEQLALSGNSAVKASDGASTTLTQYSFVTANSNGLNAGYQTTRYSRYLSLIGEGNNGMQTDYWYSSSRDFNELKDNPTLAQHAIYRLTRRLTHGKYTSGKPKVIFESTIAKSIIGSLIGALSGNNLFRKLSFLNDSMGKLILPSWLSINEDPFVIKGQASCYFDNEGSKVSPRDIIHNGVVNGYLLSGYTARKMGLRTTGNAGGSHNLQVTANFAGNLEALAKEMQQGIIIIETIGHGLNMVTGNYSVGASGLVVENGSISHFTDNLTIAGNMSDIFKNIQLIANDCEPSAVRCGSMLIAEGVIQISC